MKHKKIVSVTAKVMLAAITMGLILGNPFGRKAEAAKKVKLSTKKLTVTVKKTKVLKLKNNKKKVKWSVTSGKKFIKLKSKKKTRVKIVGKKAGKSKVQAKIGKKKYVCKVTVKASPKKDDKSTENKKKEYTISGYVYSKSGTLVKSSLLTIKYGQGSYEKGYSSWSGKVDAKTGKYSVRVKPGVYNIVTYESQSEETEGVCASSHRLSVSPVVVKDKNVTRNLTLQDECVQTKLLKGDGAPITDRIYVSGICKKPGTGINSTEEALYPDKAGNILWIRDNSFWIKNCKEYLSDIYYKISLNGYLLKEIPCMQKDIFGVTWKYNIYKVEGYITNRGNESRALFGLDEDTAIFNDFRVRRDGASKYEEAQDYSMLSDMRNHSMGFSFYAKPGTYFLERGYARAVGSISVKDRDIKNCHVNFNTYKVEINLEQDGSSGYDNLDTDWIYFCRDGTEYMQDSDNLRNCWLEPGTYEIKMENEDYDIYANRLVTVGNFTVTDSDKKIDIRY